jgi:hypothetical protein
MRFDTDSFLIGVNSFALVTMATQPEQFEDLILDVGQSVQGIEGGLAIKGHGTFIFNSASHQDSGQRTSLTSSFVSSPRNIGIGYKRPTTALEEQGWKLTLTASFSSGDTEIIGARFLTVATRTLLFFAQLQPRQHIAPSPHTPKRWKPISTTKNTSSGSLDVVA